MSDIACKNWYTHHHLISRVFCSVSHCLPELIDNPSPYLKTFWNVLYFLIELILISQAHFKCFSWSSTLFARIDRQPITLFKNILKLDRINIHSFTSFQMLSLKLHNAWQNGIQPITLFLKIWNSTCLGTKNAFFVLHMHGPMFFFFKTMHSFKILKDYLVSVGDLKCLNLLCIVGNRHWFLVPINWLFFFTQTSLEDIIVMLLVCFILCKLTLFIDNPSPYLKLFWNLIVLIFIRSPHFQCFSLSSVQKFSLV